MKRHHVIWSIAVLGIIGTAYGMFSLIYNATHGKSLSLLGLTLFVAGIVFLATFIVLYILSLKKKKENDVAPPPEEEPVVEEEVETNTPEEEPVSTPAPTSPSEKIEYVPSTDNGYESSSTSYTSTVYVKQVGYGPILRVEGNRILDMRTSTYYRIENHVVMQEGSGLIFEIRGNQIKNAFGGYLYEISGSNINKVFGGFYASISGNYITLYDLSVKYEMTDSLSKKQLLVIAALLFGKY